ncbi:LacI family DNA-binding transcriptional regulator [uncultured Victivallis sp.]|uniref:LacI family DNA-binding transcriptional regulator n=1 Tax=uncultured Victivallis sp. TaxID=354118 RepID=UPI0025FDCF64|nr:LacI family DNA-binding transcriptional regulator [uncultured Victivallis sp.]
MASDINELARQCGVSKATISRVFTGRARVSEEVRARVLAAARRLNYRPQQVMARDCVAIVVADLPSPQRRLSFSERLLTSAVFEITRNHLQTEVIPVRDLSRLYDSYTRAVLLLLSEPYIEAHRAEFERLPMPVVTVNKQYPFSSSVNTDHGQGVTLALRHLHENGHRRIGLTVDRLENQAGQERIAAYGAFVKERGLVPLPVGHFYNLTAGESLRALDHVLAERPTALVVCGESMALQSVHELRRRGYRIPEDISLVTSELEEICCWLTPELTTINQDLDALAAKTVSVLLARIREPDLPREDIRLPSSLIVRSSVRRVDA